MRAREAREEFESEVPEPTPKSSPLTPDDNRPRRALVVADAASRATDERLAAAGYETLRTTAGGAARAVAEFAPDVVLVAVGEGYESQTEAVALARSLRADAATYALPVVIIFQEDARALRGAALGVGVDDYFALTTPADEMRARLDALFWRVEANRRAAPVAGDQRSEIDNFILLLEAVRADVEGGAHGTLALIGSAAALGGARGAAARAPSISQVYGFFKLNLRRADSVAFYGPTILLAYLPRRTSAEAQSALAALREDYLKTRRDVDLAIGLASFPADGKEVEQLVERAEGCMEAALARVAESRVITYRAKEEAKRSTPQPSPAGHVEAGASKSTDGRHAKANVEAGPKPDVASNRRSDDGRQNPAVAAPAQSAREARMLDAIDAATASLSRAGGTGDGRPAAASAQGAHASRKTRRLLLAVSDAARMAQLNLLIRSAATYEVRAAFDGQQALSLLRIERPDLLLVDYELQDMDGVEMLRRLRKQQGGTLSLPALLLLPAGHDEAGREASEIGARALVALPYNPDELLDTIRTVGSGLVQTHTKSRHHP